MKAVFLKDHGNHKAETTIDLSPFAFQRLQAEGIVELVSKGTPVVKADVKPAVKVKVKKGRKPKK